MGATVGGYLGPTYIRAVHQPSLATPCGTCPAATL